MGNREGDQRGQGLAGAGLEVRHPPLFSASVRKNMKRIGLQRFSDARFVQSVRKNMKRKGLDKGKGWERESSGQGGEAPEETGTWNSQVIIVPQ